MSTCGAQRTTSLDSCRMTSTSRASLPQRDASSSARARRLERCEVDEASLRFRDDLLADEQHILIAHRERVALECGRDQWRERHAVGDLGEPFEGRQGQGVRTQGAARWNMGLFYYSDARANDRRFQRGVPWQFGKSSSSAVKWRSSPAARAASGCRSPRRSERWAPKSRSSARSKEELEHAAGEPSPPPASRPSRCLAICPSPIEVPQLVEQVLGAFRADRHPREQRRRELGRSRRGARARVVGKSHAPECRQRLSAEPIGGEPLLHSAPVGQHHRHRIRCRLAHRCAHEGRRAITPRKAPPCS